MILRTLLAAVLTYGTAAAQDIPDCGPEPVDGWVSPDWHQNPPAEAAVEIPDARILVVPAAAQPAAISALTNVDIVPLASADLKALFPSGAPSAPGTPFLVRGVLANEMGHFYARALGDTLWIENFTLGCFHMTKVPLVVFLDDAPAILKVGVGGAF
jgi:hypothetical protein